MSLLIWGTVMGNCDSFVFIHLLSCVLLFHPLIVSQLCHWFLQVVRILWLLVTVPEWGDVGTAE